ncbi:MAG: hypothetical protein ACYC40_02570, partial [Patescibacteria group bacterium]
MNIIRGLIYILQREDYQAGRFLSFVYSDWRWWLFEKRQTIDWTNKARAIYFLLCLSLCILIALSIYFLHFFALLLIIILVLLLPLLILLVLYLFSPIDYILKRKTISRAKKILSGIKTPVIGITGSYGKTSLKEILAIVLGSSLKIINTPNNINTDL